MTTLFASNGEETFESLIDKLGDAVCETDGKMNFLAANRTFAMFYGLTDPSVLINKSAFEVYPHFKSSVFYEACARTIETGEPCVRHGFSYNLTRWISIRCDKIAEDRYIMVVSFPHDSTTRQGVQKHDELTSLPNRVEFEEDVEALAGAMGGLALLLLDIRHFRHFNETLGFSGGDRCLMEMAARMRQGVLKNDRVYRIGSDQFVVLGSNDPADMDLRRQSLAKEMTVPWNLNGQEYALQSSIGVCRSGQGLPVTKMLAQAEQALSVAKAISADYLEFSEEMGENYNPALYKSLLDALRNQEFVVYYQPQVDLIDGKTCSAEALVRWNHPERGMIPPLEFLPFAEETGLIRDIDRAVARLVFEELALLRDQRKELPISLNLSAKTLSDLSIVDFMCDLVHQTRVNPSMVGIEITETAVMTDVETSRKVIDAFKNMGFHISIDDFGSGYSSMAYLLRYPSHFLKIDREFIQNLDKGDTHLHLVKNLINLAHSLGIGVVAEGIETQADATTLRVLRCDVGQGYHFSRPLSREDFRKWVQEKPLTKLESTLR